MRILVVTPYYKPASVYGGPVHSIAALCEGIAQKGIEVSVFTTNANGPGKMLNVPTDRPVPTLGVDVHYFPLMHRIARYLPFYAPELGQACCAHISEFDVAYFACTWTYPMAVGGKAALASDVPYIVSPRGAFMTRSLQEKWLKKQIYYQFVERNLVRSAAAIHCTSPAEQEQLRQLKLKPPSVLIPNGLDLVPFASLPIRGNLRAQLGLPEKASLSIFVGRLAPEKRIELTVDAFADVAQTLPHAHLLLIGPEAGSGRSILSRIQAHGLTDRVHMLGSLTGDALLQAYADADLLVLLSRRENFGMVVVEAMAAGIPVLLSREVGLAEEVSRAGAGCSVSASKREISLHWHRMLTLPCAERQLMVEQGRTLVCRQFAQEIVTEKMLSLLRHVENQDRIMNSNPGCGDAPVNRSQQSSSNP